VEFSWKNWWDIDCFAFMHKILPNPSRIRLVSQCGCDRCQRRVADKMWRSSLT
jgi:hypothetical protein